MSIIKGALHGRGMLVGLVGAASIILAGCQGTESSVSTTTAATYPVAAAASLATVSATNYNDNEYGLITGSTLTRWIDDWAANKPAHISGELIILQASDGTTVDPACDTNGDGTGVCKYFTPAPGVRSYSLDSTTWVEARDNGVTETISMVLSGQRMDALLAAYDIDPRSDMIVFAMGQAGGSIMLVGRAHYLFRYWGAEANHLAMLDGGATHDSVIPAASRGLYLGESNSGPAPTGGTVTVKDLMADNTVLQATLGDMMAVARGEVPDAFVWDARSPTEWGGSLYSTGGTNADCVDINDINANANTTETVGCKTAMNGTVHGAVNLNYTDLLATDGSYRYLDKTTLATMVSNLGYTAGQTVYTFCRTTYRAMVTGTVAGTILGYPTRYYDGAMIEWLQMANYQNKTAATNLPATSPWQTAALTDNLTYNDPSYVDLPVITDAYAGTSDVIVEADRLYKTGTTTTASTDGSGGSGSSLPANPCGG